MATNHFALYCAVSNDKTHYKIGMTQQTKRAREGANFAIAKYVDFYGINEDRELLFAMEDHIRDYMAQYYKRDYKTNDYFFIENYSIKQFAERFMCGIAQLVEIVEETEPDIQYCVEDYLNEVDYRIERNKQSMHSRARWREFLAEHYNPTE